MRASFASNPERLTWSMCVCHRQSLFLVEESASQWLSARLGTVTWKDPRATSRSPSRNDGNRARQPAVFPPGPTPGRWQPCRLVISALLLAFTAGAARADLDLREVARTGDMIPDPSSPIASFGQWVSINDQGTVGFKAKRLDGSEIIVKATPNASGGYDYDPVAEGDGTEVRFSDYVGINADGNLSYRRRLATPTVHFSIRRDLTSVAGTGSPEHFASLMQQTDVSTAQAGMVSFYGMVLEGTQIRNHIRRGDGSTGSRVDDTDLIAKQPEFSSFNFYTSINDSSQVVFTGSHPAEGAGVFVGDGSSWGTVATTATGFTATGISPSINNSGHVAFYGERGTEAGIYIWRAGAPELVVPVGDPISGVDADSRVALNDYWDVAFVGTVTDGGVRALFRDCGFGPEVLVKIGDEINGSAPIDGIELWDGLRVDAELVFWARHDNGDEAVYVCGPPILVIDPNPHLMDGADVTTDVAQLGFLGTRVKGLAADGVTRVVLRVVVPGPGNVEFSIYDDLGSPLKESVGTLSTPGGNEEETTLTVNVDSLPGRYMAFVILTAPLDFCRDYEPDDLTAGERPITVWAEYTPSGGGSQPSVFSRNIELHRPPVLLLHGMWGSSSTWGWDQFRDDGSQTRFTVHRANYVPTNASRFSVNADVPRTGIVRAVQKMRDQGIAATQADVIGHSMGAVLTRKYIADDTCYKHDFNFNEGDIHKLITLDCPHMGSPLADVATFLNTTQPVCSFVFNHLMAAVFLGQTFCINCGCMEDLSTDLALPRAYVPVHAVIGTGGSDLFEAGLEHLLPPPLQEMFKIFEFFGFAPETIFPPALQHDLIVGRTSQSGGLSANNCTVVGVAEGFTALETIHFGFLGFGVPSSENVAETVVAPLNAETSDSGVFASVLPAIPRGRSVPMDPLSDPALRAERTSLPIDGGIQITSPVPGTIVTPGSQLPVVVEANGGFIPVRVLVVSSGDGELDYDSPFEVQLEILPDAIGEVRLGAYAFDADDNLAEADEMVLPVDVSAALTGISLDPETLHLFSFAPTQWVTVIGHYDDGIDRNLTPSVLGTSYETSDQTIASVDTEGVVTAHSVGTTILTATNAGHSSTADIVVVSVRGDFDGDGDVDLADYAFLADCFAGPFVSTTVGDYDGDGDVDLEDFAAPGGGCEDKDLDADGDVDLADFGEFQQCLANPGGCPGGSLPSVQCRDVFDFDTDDDVDLLDFQGFALRFTGSG